MRYSGHVDRFAEKRLPSGDAMPELRFDLPALHYPEKLNAAAWLLDRRIAGGDGRRRCILAPASRGRTTICLRQLTGSHMC